ncbi:hypothetical protein PoB_002402200, partial [Plakobranchus ocellatus]
AHLCPRQCKTGQCDHVVSVQIVIIWRFQGNVVRSTWTYQNGVANGHRHQEVPEQGGHNDLKVQG